MILLVILHSVAIFVFLFEWLKDKLAIQFVNKQSFLYQLKLFQKSQLRKRRKSEICIRKPKEKIDLFTLLKIPSKY